MEELERTAREMAGVEIELTVPADVSDVLFRVLALPPPPCASIRGSRHLSTKVGCQNCERIAIFCANAAKSPLNCKSPQCCKIIHQCI